MTAEYIHAFSRRMTPEACWKFALESERAQGMPGALLHPRSRVQDALKNAHTSIQVQPNSPAFPAQWPYGLCRALPGDEFVLPPSPAN